MLSDPLDVARPAALDRAERGFAIAGGHEALERLEPIEQVRRSRDVGDMTVDGRDVHDVALRQQGGAQRSPPEDSSVAAGDQQPGQARVHRQTSHRVADPGRSASVDRAEVGQERHGAIEDGGLRSLEPAEFRQIPLAPGQELEGRGGEVDPADLRSGGGGQTPVVVLGPQPQA